MMYKVTARNKWRVLRIGTFVCMRYASALSAVHNMAESISQVILYFRQTLNLELRWYMHNDVHKVTARNKRC
jgi:hypothetical protein